MVARDDELSLLKPDSAQLVSADRPASREAINNRSATDLMNTAFNDRDPRAAARRYVDVHTYIQHNPNFANGREAQIVGMEAMVNQFPPCSIEVRRTVAQGDLVVVQSLFKTAPDDRGTVVIDTFRFDRRGKIVEHWDALQPVAADSANANPQV